MATVAGTPFDFDELLAGTSSPWRRRLIAGAAVLIVVAVAAFFIWNNWFRCGSSTAAPVFTEATVTTGNVTKTISTSGTVSAESTANLNFSSAQKITKVNVTVGQAVKQGDVLAEIDASDANNALKSAQSNLANAQLNLQDVLDGSTAAQLANADQNVLQAQASYDKAVQALSDLQAPPDALTVQTAQQAVTDAQAKLATAQEARANLDTKAAADVTSAQAALTKAQDALTSAYQARDDASASLSTAEGALNNAESTYCIDDSTPSFCAAHAAPVANADVTILVAATNGSDPTAAADAQKVLSANSSYRSAVTTLDRANASISDAQSGVTSAQDALDAAEAEPSAAQVASADAAVSAAQLGVASANQKLSDLLAGPSQSDLNDAKLAVSGAAASLASAKDNRDTAYAGSTAAQIQQARTSVQQAETSVSNAQKTVDETKLTAPFDGTVAAVNIQVGDTSSSGGGASSASAAVVLNTPSRLVLNLTIAETDYPSVKAGQTGVATFSALTGEEFPFVIDSVGANPTTTQGVVTYQARAHLATGQEAARILSSLRSAAANGFGGRRAAAASGTPGTGAQALSSGTPRADRTPGAFGGPRGDVTPNPALATAIAEGTPPAALFGGGANGTRGFGQALANQTQPAPGMSATVEIIVEQKTGVVMVPLKAVQTKNRQTVVTVKNADGTTQDVQVATGLSDAANTEITSGLTDGQTIEVPGATATTTVTQALPSTGGTRGGFFGGGGGGGFAGRAGD
jgi:multidrug efflux pump subunit AcrA (membrane-fusion protein)